MCSSTLRNTIFIFFFLGESTLFYPSLKAVPHVYSLISVDEATSIYPEQSGRPLLWVGGNLAFFAPLQSLCIENSCIAAHDKRGRYGTPVALHGPVLTSVGTVMDVLEGGQSASGNWPYPQGFLPGGHARAGCCGQLSVAASHPWRFNEHWPCTDVPPGQGFRKDEGHLESLG